MRNLIWAISILVMYPAVYLFSQPVFDLRDYNGNNYVTSVKQQQGGTCWTHGAFAAIEGNLLLSGKWQQLGDTTEPNLAEYHLDWWNGFNKHNNDDITPATGDGLVVHRGGDYMVTSAYTSRGEGPVLELGIDMYESAPDRRSSLYKHFYVRDIEWYDVQENFNYINNIKMAIKTHGVIGTCMCSSGMYINDYIHHQPNSSMDEPNHAIAIVGWDDTLTTPAKFPGAWKCKNSWGEGWGYDGYFWISFYDKYSIRHPEMGAVSFQNTEEMKYSTVYYHDYHGWRDTFEGISKAFNKFICGAEEYLSAVSFYTAEDYCNCTIKVFDDFANGELSNEFAIQQVFIARKGFHTIDLETPVRLTEGDDFYIFVQFSSGGHPYDRTSEIPVLLGVESPELTSVTSTASPDQSYYSEDGVWKDLYEYDQSANFCIKGLTTLITNIREEERSGVPADFILKQNYPNPFNPTTKIEFILPESAHIKIVITDILGNNIETIASGRYSAGKYSFNFDAKGLSSGIYFYSLFYKDYSITKKMILIR